MNRLRGRAISIADHADNFEGAWKRVKVMCLPSAL